MLFENKRQVGNIIFSSDTETLELVYLLFNTNAFIFDTICAFLLLVMMKNLPLNILLVSNTFPRLFHIVLRVLKLLHSAK